MISVKHKIQAFLGAFFLLATHLPCMSAENVASESKKLLVNSSIDVGGTKPVVIAVRKVKNLAGRYVEDGVDADNNMVGFWKPAYEIRLAEMLSTELANTGNFTVVERENLYEVFAEQSLSGVNPATKVKKENLTPANFIIIASLSDYVPNTTGVRRNQAGRIAILTFANDREKIDTYIAFDLRIINTKSGSVAYSRTIEGTSSSTKKSDTLGLNFNVFFGAGGGSGTTITQESTPASRAIRAAMVNIVEYINCQLYLKDQCIAKFEAEDAKRRESTKGTLNLF